MSENESVGFKLGRWGLTICFALFLIWLFKSLLTQSILLYSESPDGSYGQVGDFFNGMISPIIGLLSAGLVFIAFREQVKANKALMRLQEQTTSIELCRQFTEFLQLKQREIDKRIDGHPSKSTKKHTQTRMGIVNSIQHSFHTNDYEVEMIDRFTEILKSVHYAVTNNNWKGLSAFQRSIIADIIYLHICKPVTDFEYFCDKKQNDSDKYKNLEIMRFQAKALFDKVATSLEKEGANR